MSWDRKVEMNFNMEFSLVVLPHWANSFTLIRGLVIEQLLFNVPGGVFLIAPLCYVNQVLIGLLGSDVVFNSISL